MIKPIASSWIADQFPEVLWSLIPSTLKNAYAAVDKLIEENPILKIESAQDNKGRIISWSTDFAFKRLIESGKLPFDYAWKPFAKPTGRYLEIRLPHSVASISQVSDSVKQPRDVLFRENLRLANEPFLAFSEFAEEQVIKGLPHILLIHGYQSLNFAHLAVPNENHKKGYSFKTPNLMNLAHATENNIAPEENTDIDFNEIELLKEDINKWRRDNAA